MPPTENIQPGNPAADLFTRQEETIEDTDVKIDSLYSEFKRMLHSENVSTIPSLIRRIFRFVHGNAVEGEHPDQVATVVSQLHSQSKDLSQRLKTITFERDQLKADEESRDDAKDLLVTKKQLQHQQDEIKQLKSQVHDMTKEYQEYYQKASNEIQSLTQDNSKLRRKLETSEEQCKIHRQQAAKFREIIQKKDIGPEVDDNIITAQFRKLAEQIQRIIRTSYTVTVALPTPKETDQTLVKNLYSCFQHGLTPSESQNRVRGLIFDFLNDWIILRATFGLAEMDKRSVVEYGLTEFEEMINENSTVSKTETAEWRTMTLKFAQALRPTDSPQTHCLWVAEEIFWALSPLELGKNKHQTAAANEAERDKLQSQWEQLCTDAFELTMMLRSHKDVYRCEFPPRGQVLQDEDAEAQAGESTTHRGEKKAESEEQIVVYALSGALVRYPVDDPGKRIVLQKAWVVVEE
ncbi:hypothetical protein NHQ30_002617 [Ciborinia camelliae]|nr:hypothetical protein NHQ30_002617 [Ciborinia camelliae]